MINSKIGLTPQKTPFYLTIMSDILTIQYKNKDPRTNTVIADRALGQIGILDIELFIYVFT